MSAQFGLFSASGRPIDEQAFEAMRKAIAYWGPGFASVDHESFVVLGKTGAKPVSGPAKHSPTGVIASTHARIDNREELFDLLRMPAERRQSIADDELILEAYLHWGEKCAERLLGDWTFAIWDPRESKVVLARDHRGMKPLYYHFGGPIFSFCSSIKGLLALPWVPKRPNLFRISKVLATWPTDGVETSYEGIARVPAGHVVSVSAGNCRVRPYWEPKLSCSANLRSEPETIEAFLDLYSQAVRCRMRRPETVGMALSGGLDSGSVCALAARELGKGSTNLNAFSSAPLFPCVFPKLRFGDETPYVEANREFMTNVLVHYVRAEEVSPLSGIDRALELLDEPTHGAANAFWLVALMHEAQNLGVRTLLTGAMGNSTVSWPGVPSCSLAQKARLYLLLSWAKPIRNRLRQARGQEPWLAYSPLNPSFTKAQDLVKRRKDEGYDPNFEAKGDPHQLRLDQVRRDLRISGADMNEFGAGFGIQSADPTSDKRIIEFCLALPIEVFQRDGMNRRLIRLAMAGLLPDKVRLNRLRGAQAADLLPRLVASAGQISEALDQLQANPLATEILDLGKMRRVFQDLPHRSDQEMAARASMILMRGLMAGRLLSRF